MLSAPEAAVLTAEKEMRISFSAMLSTPSWAGRQPARRARRRRRLVPEIAARPPPSVWRRLANMLWLVLCAPARTVSCLLAVLLATVARVFALFDTKRKQIQVRVVRGAQQITKDAFLDPAAITRAREAARKFVLSPSFAALMRPMLPSACTSSARSFPAAPRRKTLVLDLDETLVHSQFKLTEACDVRLDILDNQFTTIFYVAKRPYLDVFLRTTAQWYDIAIFTASVAKYADPLISTLDTHRVVQRRLYRQDCSFVNGNFVKDLTRVQPNLRDVLIVDNSPAAYTMHPANAVPIEAWYSDPRDEELLNLLPLLHSIAFLDDVRSILQLRLSRGALSARSSRQ